MKKIALIGMMGSGKSEIGRLLARNYGIDFVDMDKAIEENTKTTIPAIFHDFGEEYFRDLEENQLALIASIPRSIVLSCGGGVVLRDSNRKILNNCFLTIWLDVSIAELKRRLQDQRHQRPLLRSEKWESEIEEIYCQRHELYRKAARIRYTCNNNHSLEESAIDIQKLIDAAYDGISGRT